MLQNISSDLLEDIFADLSKTWVINQDWSCEFRAAGYERIHVNFGADKQISFVARQTSDNQAIFTFRDSSLATLFLLRWGQYAKIDDTPGI